MLGNILECLKNDVCRFETYVKAKDLDLWHIILNGDFPLVARNKDTQVLEVVPFEEQSDDLKKKLAKNNEAKMVLYNALPKKEYERIFMCKTAKDIWQSLLITHQEESINSGFARFNTIITSLKALDEGFSSKNYVRKFLRALHPKWRAKVIEIEESKDLSSLALDELIGNQEKKISHSDKGMKRNERVIENALDAVVQIISLPIVEKHLATKIKRLSLEVLGAIAKMTPRIKLTIKLVSWLNRQMSQKSSSHKIGLGFDSSKASTSGTKPINLVGSSAEFAPDECTIKAYGSTISGSVDLSNSEKRENTFLARLCLQDQILLERN
ncbi:hypothetical protein Tco_1237897 [Tanacetum coccineum]